MKIPHTKSECCYSNNAIRQFLLTMFIFLKHYFIPDAKRGMLYV